MELVGSLKLLSKTGNAPANTAMKVTKCYMLTMYKNINKTSVSNREQTQRQLLH